MLDGKIINKCVHSFHNVWILESKCTNLLSPYDLQIKISLVHILLFQLNPTLKSCLTKVQTQVSLQYKQNMTHQGVGDF